MNNTLRLFWGFCNKCAGFLLLTISLLFITVYPVFSQVDVTAGETSNISARLEMSTADASSRIMLARSSADYRVTPGDVYTLSYIAGAVPVTYMMTVDPSYRIRVSNLGVVNGAGKTFIQVRDEVETIVSNNFPLSGVQLVITQPSTFRVYVKGEVNRSGETSAWALTRLSSLIGENLTEFASTRDVSVKSSNGQVRVYDLFRVWRFGDFSQDPYLRPGDEITFNRLKRSVMISGEVERPGTYQLLDGENIIELIDFYGSGYRATADKTRIEMIRIINSDDISGSRIIITENDLKNNITLETNDRITIPSTIQLMPVMFVEGAVVSYDNDSKDSRELITSNRLTIRFFSGDTYESLTRRNISWFSEVSDIQNAYILRNNERILIDLNVSLYDPSYLGEIFVQDNDILVIPFRQYFVSVAGAVAHPGRYPYIPDRDWEYYIGLAGGVIPSRNSKNSVKIFDINGKQLNKTDLITPETTITADTNHFLYSFSQYGPVVTTALSLILSFLSLYITATK